MTSERDNYGDFIPFVKPADFNVDGSLDYENDGLTVKGLSEARKVAARSVLMVCIGATIGKCGYCERDITTNQQINAFTPFSDVSYKFLYYQMLTETFQRKVLLNSGQATLPIINKSKWSALTVVVPSKLEEQQRIVGILDETFEGIATAKANAEKNLQNARALFKSYLQSTFTQPRPGWTDTTIGQQIHFIDYRGKTPVKTEHGIRLITAKNVKMGYLQQTPMEFVAPGSYESWMTRGIPRFGDVLFTTEAPLANVAQLDTDEKVVFAQRIITMQPDRSRLDSTFLKYLLLSQPVQQRILAKGTGATVKGIKASLLRTIEISFPKSIAEQELLVDKLDALTEETQRLVSIYQRKLVALDALKKSLLHHAFTGQL